MPLTRTEEKRYWERMPEPKPAWEIFKRMMPQFGSNPLAVQYAWENEHRKTQARANNNHGQDL